jgi:hypothetical protein
MLRFHPWLLRTHSTKN